MIKIKHFAIENYRAFNGLKNFEFSPITFLIGKNSSGKSSLLSGIQLINVEPIIGVQIKSSDRNKNDEAQSDKYSIYQEIFKVEQFRNILASVKYIIDQYDNKHYFFDYLFQSIKLSDKDFNNKMEILLNDLVSLKVSMIVNAFKEIKTFYKMLKSRNDIYIEFYNNLESSFEINESDIQLDIYERDYFEINSQKLFFNNENFFSNPLSRFENSFIDLIIENSFIDLFEAHKNIFKKYDQAYFIGIHMNRLEKMSLLEIENELDIEMNKRIEMLKQIKISDLIKDFDIEREKTKFEKITKRNAEEILQLTLDKLFDEYKSIKTLSSAFNFNDTHIEFIKNCLTLFKLGIDIEIEAQSFSSKPNERFYNIYIYDIEGNKKELSNDFGFGIFTLVSIIISVSFNNKSVFLIEEPEAFLHPNLQSLLADFFVMAHHKFGTQFLIETHSEYLIRRMQLLIANSKYRKDNTLPIIKKDLSKIFYFNSPNEIKNPDDHIYPINFNDDGSLDGNFGNGFFDEASNSAYDLYSLLNNLN